MAEPRYRTSAGLLLHRAGPDGVQVLLGHIGGPYFARKDDAAWSIPKGEYDPAQETPWAAAQREFTEELGLPVPAGEPLTLGEVVQSGGKRVTAFALAGDLDPRQVTLGTFEMEWPPRSGRRQSFPELDRVVWFDLETARPKLVSAQRAFLGRLADSLGPADA